MKSLSRVLLIPALAIAAVTATANTAHAQVTSTSSFSNFLSLVGPVTTETFGQCCHFPLGSTLNSLSSYPAQGINPGDIQPGVTYSVSAGPLLIDGFGGFPNGGFLDGIAPNYGTVGPLMVHFTGAVSGFGYWFNTLAGTNSITVNTTGGSYGFSVIPSGGMEFIGFVSNSVNITDAVISGTDQTFNFALDDFSFSAVTPVTAVPEPTTTVLLGAGLFGLFAAARRRKLA